MYFKPLQSMQCVHVFSSKCIVSYAFNDPLHQNSREELYALSELYSVLYIIINAFYHIHHIAFI